MDETSVSKLKLTRRPPSLALHGEMPKEAPARKPRRFVLSGFVCLCVIGVGAYWFKDVRSIEMTRERFVEGYTNIEQKLGQLIETMEGVIGSEGKKQPLRLPANGTEYLYHTDSTFAEFKIINRSDEKHAIIKIEDFETGKPVAKYFVRADSEIRKLLPEGRFRIKTASGMSWYGEPVLFGSRTKLVVLEQALTVTRNNNRYWLNHSSIEINLPFGSTTRSLSKSLSSRSW